MRQHSITPIGRHDTDADILRIADTIQMRVVHGARVERRNLVIIQIRRDKRLGREYVLDDADMILTNALALQPFAVRPGVGAGCSHRQGIVTEKFQVIRNIDRTAAELATHLGNQE